MGGNRFPVQPSLAIVIDMTGRSGPEAGECCIMAEDSDGPSGSVAVAGDELRLLIERAERLEEEKKGISDDLKDVMAEAKSRGFDVKTMRAIMAIRKKDKDTYQEEQAILETYKQALGM